MTREPIYKALFDKLNELPQFVTKSRKLLHWQDVPKHNQPALFTSQDSEHAETTTSEPTVWTLRVDVYVYSWSAGEDAATKLNELIDAVCNKINATHPVTGRSMLLTQDAAYFCRVSGTIDISEGTLGDQSVAIIPIEIKANQEL